MLDHKASISNGCLVRYVDVCVADVMKKKKKKKKMMMMMMKMKCDMCVEKKERKEKERESGRSGGVQAFNWNFATRRLNCIKIAL